MKPEEFIAAKPTKCDPCDEAKQTRASHPPDDTRAPAPLFLVHMDVCGPLPTGLGHNRYFVTLLDDHTNLSVTLPFQTKDQVPALIIDTLKMLENQVNERVTSVRTDNGSEFVNRTLQEFFKSRGIYHEKSATYTPSKMDVRSG